MSTIGLTNWAVDLKDIGAVYPFQGYEVPMVAAGVIFWLWWHVAQARMESRMLADAEASYRAERIQSSVDRY